MLNATPYNASYYSETVTDTAPELMVTGGAGNKTTTLPESILKSPSKNKTLTASYSSYKSLGSLRHGAQTQSHAYTGEPKWILTRVTKYVQRTVRQEKVC
jgi:hypothetical protein